MEEIKEMLKSIINMAVNNSKKADNAEGEDEMQIENEKVDKRKLIDEVAGIMKSAGCDDEDIRTAIGKMEKIGYDESEAENKKVKNEAEEKEAENKCKNEDDEEKAENKCKNADDEEKAEEVKEEVKEDVENKCKNSVENSKTDFFEKMNEIYNSAKSVRETKVYVSRSDRLKAGEEMFK